MSYIYFDIETIPSQDSNLLAEIRKGITAPARYKKQDSIDAWLRDNGDAAAAEQLAKTSFDGGLGHVCAISWAKDDGEISSVAANDCSPEKERGIISEFFSSFDPYHSGTLVGHYITGFDIPFLLKRAVVLGVQLPPNVAFPRDPKPWSDVHDTMFMWAGAKGSISMDKLCDILGIPGKDGFDGSMVADAWLNGEFKKIAEYCADDLSRVRQIHQKFLKAGW